MTEFDLVKRLQELLHDKGELSQALKEVNRKLMEAEQKLYEALTAEDKLTTATYEKLGYATLVKPAVRAWYSKENEGDVFSFLREEGREDMIKLTVNNKSLCSFLRDRLEDGKPISKFIEYFLQPRVWLYDENGKRIGWSTKEEGEQNGE